MKRTIAVIGFLLLPALAWHGCAGDGSQLVDDVIPMDPCEGVVPEPTLATVQANTFSQSCGVAPCHTTTGFAPMSLETVEDSFANLVGVPSNDFPELLRVEPENSNDSYLVWKLLGEDPEGEGSIAGQLMPFGGPMLPAEQIADIEQWILNGACP